MASAPTTGIPGNASLYGTGYSSLAAPQQVPANLFNGLGPAQLNTSQIPLQTFNPQGLVSDTSKLNDWNNVINALSGDPGGTLLGNGGIPISALDGYSGTLSGLEADRDKANSDNQNIQNQNVAGYNATQSANAQNIGYLQQAAIAQNRLLGQLNSRGLLNSFENGGAGTGDFQQLQNSLDNAINSHGQSLQNELSGLSQQDAMYQMALSNYNNEMNNFGQMQKSNIPGLSDIMGLGVSALSAL